MTREEAIKLLRNWDGVYIGYSSDEVEEALDMAIKALSQEPCEDVVSRQAVINAIENDCMRGGLGSCFACYNDAQAFRGEIEKLPSVTQKSGKWIPVSERLPKSDGYYIVTENSGRVCTYVFHKEGNSEEYWKRCAIAWMPLPEPYEPQESEE